MKDRYTAFSSLLKQRKLEPVKKADFKAMVAPLTRKAFKVALRNDRVKDANAGIRGWKKCKLEPCNAGVIVGPAQVHARKGYNKTNQIPVE